MRWHRANMRDRVHAILVDATSGSGEVGHARLLLFVVGPARRQRGPRGLAKVRTLRIQVRLISIDCLMLRWQSWLTGLKKTFTVDLMMLL